MTENRRGRPRSESVDHAILEATRDLLTSVGYERMSMEAVAGRAGVAKMTLYRRWATKSAVVIDAVLGGYLNDRPGALGPPVTSDLQVDLKTWLDEQISRLGEPGIAALVRGLVAAASDHDEPAGSHFGQLTKGTRALLVRRFEVAVQAGELPPGADLHAGADAVMALLLYPVLTRESGLTDRQRMLSLIMKGMGS